VSAYFSIYAQGLAERRQTTANLASGIHVYDLSPGHHIPANRAGQGQVVQKSANISVNLAGNAHRLRASQKISSDVAVHFDILSKSVNVAVHCSINHNAVPCD